MSEVSTLEALLGELDQEAAATRRVLQNVPTDQLEFRPHEKSMTMGALAMHVARLSHLGSLVLTQTEFDVATAEAPPRAASTDAILAEFEDRLATLRATLTGYAPAALGELWTLRFGDHALFTLPRAAVLRSLLMNHLIHHRGQLTVYLRLTGARVPGVYGPSADEPFGA